MATGTDSKEEPLELDKQMQEEDQSEDLAQKKSDLLMRLQRLSDRVKVFDAKTVRPVEPLPPIFIEAVTQEVTPPVEPPDAKKPPKPQQISSADLYHPQKLDNGGIRPEEVTRVLKTLEGVLSDQRYLSDDYRRSIAQLNDLQTRSKLVSSRIDRALEQLHRKEPTGSREESLTHLMDQLAVSLRNRPAAQRTLEELREEYDVVISQYF